MSRPLSSTFTSHPAEASLPPLRTSAPRNPTPATPVKPSPELNHPHPDVSADTRAVDSHINTNVNGQGHGQEQGNGTSTGFSVLRTQPGGSGLEDWEAEYERQKNRAWEEKVKADLQGWRGGHGQVQLSFFPWESSHEMGGLELTFSRYDSILCHDMVTVVGYDYHYSGLHDHRTLSQHSRPCRISTNPSLEKLGNIFQRRW